MGKGKKTAWGYPIKPNLSVINTKKFTMLLHCIFSKSDLYKTFYTKISVYFCKNVFTTHQN
jgi:hypothetical protein